MLLSPDLEITGQILKYIICRTKKTGELGRHWGRLRGGFFDDLGRIGREKTQDLNPENLENLYAHMLLVLVFLVATVFCCLVINLHAELGSGRK